MCQILFEVFLRNSIVFLLLAFILIIFGSVIFTRSYHLKEGRLAALCVLAYGIANFMEYIRHTVSIEYNYFFHIWGSSIFALLGLALSTSLIYTHMTQNPTIKIRFTFNYFVLYGPIVVYAIAQLILYNIAPPHYYQQSNWYFSDSTIDTTIMHVTCLWYIILLYRCIIEGLLVAPRKLKIHFVFNGLGLALAVLFYMFGLRYTPNYLTPDPLITILGLTSFVMVTLNLLRFDEFSPSMTKHYQVLLQFSPNAILIIDENLKIKELNSLTKKLFSVEQEMVLHQDSKDCAMHLLWQLYENLMADKKIEKKIFHLEHAHTTQTKHLLIDGKIVRDQQSESYFFIIQDVTEEYEKEQANHYLAYHDALTDLPNRLHFQQQVEPLLKKASDATPGIFVIMDLNFFKQINDTYGHHVGDEVLKHTATLLRTNVTKQDPIARLGGDEFVCYFPNTLEEDFRSRLQAWRLSFALSPYVHNDIKIDVVPSFGYAIATSTCNNYEELYHIADMQMYHDKQLIKTPNYTH